MNARRLVLVSIIAFLAVSPSVRAQSGLGPWGKEWLSGSVGISIQSFQIDSIGSVEYQCISCLDSGWIESGAHRIFDGGSGVVASARSEE